MIGSHEGDVIALHSQHITAVLMKPFNRHFHHKIIYLVAEHKDNALVASLGILVVCSIKAVIFCIEIRTFHVTLLLSKH